MMLVQSVGFVAVLAFAFAWPLGAPLRGNRSALSAIPLYGMFLVVWAPVAMWGIPELFRALGADIEPQRHLAYFTGPLDSPWFIVVLLSVTALGPITEEVLFRGYLQSGAVGLLGRRTGVVVVAIAFGLVHVNVGWYAFLPITALGLFFGWLRERTGGLAAPILAHCLHNALTVATVIAAPELLP
jgi:membrane protease YdiL (CAAX protease family)